MDVPEATGRACLAGITGKLSSEERKVAVGMETSLTLLADNLSENSPSQLRRSEFLVNTCPVVIYTCKAKDDFASTFITEGVRHLWGYDPEEFLKDKNFWIDRVHPEDVARVRAGFALLPETGQAQLRIPFSQRQRGVSLGAR